MTDSAAQPPFLDAWLQAQQAFASLATSGVAAGGPGAGAEQFFAQQYRQLFAVTGLADAAPRAAAPAGLLANFQAASARFGRLLGDVAADAALRLGAALADDGPDAVPITSLRELHALWIDCGEAAWSAAAHREEFAAALAELLAATAALRAAGTAR